MKRKILSVIVLCMTLTGCTLPLEALVPRLDPISRSISGAAENVAGKIQEEKLAEEVIPETGTLWTTAALNMRTGPSTKHPVIQTLKKESQVNSLGKLSSGWYKVTFNGKTGFVSGKYLITKAPAASSSPKAAAVNTGSLVKASGSMWTTASLNMRKGTNANTGLIRTIPKGSKVEITQKSANGWYGISFEGKTGFVSGKYLTSSEVKVSPVKAASKYQPMRLYLPDRTLVYQNGGKAKGQKIIDADESYISTWGGAEVFSGSDDMNTHFIGHNTGAFKGIWNYRIGDLITVTDKNSTATTYRITKRFVVDDHATGEDGENYYNFIASPRGGEVITLQTCKTDTTNWIYRAEKVK